MINHQVVSNSSWLHGLQHARPPCPSPSPGVCPRSCPLHQWCHTTISSSVTLFSFSLQSPSIRCFSNKSAVCIRWPKYRSFSFSISPSNEYSGLISFKIQWSCFVLLGCWYMTSRVILHLRVLWLSWGAWQSRWTWVPLPFTGTLGHR